MEALATYLIRSTVWLTGFALVFALFLRNERFFVLNRIYLVSGILISVIFPFFTWHYTVVLPIVPTPEVFEPQVQGIAEVSEPFPLQNVLLLSFYISGIAYLIFRIMKQTLPVFRIIQKSETQHLSSAKLIRTAEYPASFSFFSFVFVNPSIDEIETREIVNHELEHIRQQHWIDLLLFEILRTVQWFNPAIWLYGHLIRQNHEYLADERALQRSSNPAIYRAALLNQMFGGPVISLANSFNYSLNKKRFKMMKQTISSPIRKLRLLLVLPLMAGVFYAFASPKYKFVQAEEFSINLTQNERTVKGKVIDENGKPLKSASVVISGKTIGTITDSDGIFMLKMTDDSPIVVSYVGFQTVKINPDFEKEMVIIMKRATVSINLDDQTSETRKKEQIDFNKSNALVIVDGKEITKAEMEKINPDKIASIDVLKDKASIEKYGEKAKDGVVLIKTKNTSPTMEFSAKEIEMKKGEGFILKDPQKIKFSAANSNQSLYFLDGKEIKYPELSGISPEKIESISVLKGESATKLYGEKGKDGVILITTKKGKTEADPNKEVVAVGYGKIQNKNQNNLPSSGFQIRSFGTNDKPLIVLDGLMDEKLKVEDIDPETFHSVNVLKGESTVAKYGEKGKNGVIEITTKKASDVFFIVEEMPEFPGGQEALRAFINATMKYPDVAKEKGIQGKVFVNFVVAKDGWVTDTKIMRGVDPSLDKEALRIVNNLPKWKPGKQRGEAVRVFYTVPVNFQLQEGNTNNDNHAGSGNSSKPTFTMVEEMPQFPGGVEALKTYVASSMKYPTIALENGIQGQITVKFVIDKTGSVKNVRLYRGVDPSLDKEGLRIVESMPKWTPGKQNGEAVDVAYEMPINFKLPAGAARKQQLVTMSAPAKTSRTQPAIDLKDGAHQLIIVPNPTNDKATITLKGSDSINKLEIIVYDRLGKPIKKESKNGPTFSLSFNKLPNGTYFIVAKDGENQFTGQLVVNH